MLPVDVLTVVIEFCDNTILLTKISLLSKYWNATSRRLMVSKTKDDLVKDSLYVSTVGDDINPLQHMKNSSTLLNNVHDAIDVVLPSLIISSEDQFIDELYTIIESLLIIDVCKTYNKNVVNELSKLNRIEGFDSVELRRIIRILFDVFSITKLCRRRFSAICQSNQLFLNQVFHHLERAGRVISKRSTLIQCFLVSSIDGSTLKCRKQKTLLQNTLSELKLERNAKVNFTLIEGVTLNTALYLRPN
ncbi:hypothetical protein AKO1_000984 [Acrasis kona]|uniref:F-box domain-containing protein n=1 Tax=Acrasis kona TaxID=1008807 RepID=A0AAW2ZEJ5_9EUKA